MIRARDIGRIAEIRRARLDRVDHSIAAIMAQIRIDEAAATAAQARIDANRAERHGRIAHFLETMMGTPVTRRAIDIEQDRLMLDDLEKHRLIRLRHDALDRIAVAHETLAALRRDRAAMQRSCDGVAHLQHQLASDAGKREAAIEDDEMDDIGSTPAAMPC